MGNPTLNTDQTDGETKMQERKSLVDLRLLQRHIYWQDSEERGSQSNHPSNPCITLFLTPGKWTWAERCFVFTGVHFRTEKREKWSMVIFGVQIKHSQAQPCCIWVSSFCASKRRPFSPSTLKSVLGPFLGGASQNQGCRFLFTRSITSTFPSCSSQSQLPTIIEGSGWAHVVVQERDALVFWGSTNWEKTLDSTSASVLAFASHLKFQTILTSRWLVNFFSKDLLSGEGYNITSKIETNNVQ